MARELFIYWKVPQAQAEAAHAAAKALLQALAQSQPALHARLLRRADETGSRGAQATFMEIYRAPAGGVTPAQQQAIEAAAETALAGLGVPARHVEVFESLGAPA
jgi:hypothetical protein